MIKALLVLGLAVLFSFSTQAKETIGKYIEPSDSAVITVVDGDGLKIGDIRIRLWGIDAPELKQVCTLNSREYPCGEDARFLLGALTMGGDLRCQVKDIDRYKRTVAQCFSGGRDLGGEMVRQGYALDWKQYSKGFYKPQETEAKQNKRGLWAGEFKYPWEWRKNKKAQGKSN